MQANDSVKWSLFSADERIIERTKKYTPAQRNTIATTIISTLVFIANNLITLIRRAPPLNSYISLQKNRFTKKNNVNK